MAKGHCKKEEHGNCGPIQDGDDYCIFHKPKKSEEEAREFYEKLKEQAVIETNENAKEKLVFNDDVNWGGYVFPKGHEDYFFVGATFKGDANLGNSTFESRAIFRGATFAGMAYFGGATFEGEANFRGATFAGMAYFVRATIAGEAFFVSATFADGAAFGRATFAGEAYFGYATFEDGVDFRRATFADEAFFWYTTFADGVAFWYTTFAGGASFGGAAFAGEADFGLATIAGEAFFVSATFADGAAFGFATFKGWADFKYATFKGGINFGDATFEHEASFGRTAFKGEASFGLATFKSMADFSGSSFKKVASFKGTLFERTCIFEGGKFEGELFFTNTEFRQGVAMEDWENPEPGKYKLPQAEQEGCRVQKISYENEGRKEAAEAMFVREMRARRRDIETQYEEEEGKTVCRKKPLWDHEKPLLQRFRWGNFWLLIKTYAEFIFVDLLSEYGTNWKRVVGSSLGLIGFFAVIYFISFFNIGFLGNLGQSSFYSFNFHWSWVSLKELCDVFLQSIYFSVVAFTALGSGTLNPGGLMRFIVGLQSLIGAFFIALFVVVFARKWMR